ncbi:hypothetical protein R6Q59_010140 [Mikania micrantha]
MPATTDAKPAGSNPNGKPIKLRSACNSCFSAKVRCDGDKTGCKRCLEKRLDCHYSESRVGKVVGKRRKKPLPNTIQGVSSDGWNVQFADPSVLTSPVHIPAPPQQQDKKFGPLSSWNTYTSLDDHNMIDFADCTEDQFNGFQVPRPYSLQTELPMFTNNGLPTPPGMSPTDMTFLSPAAFETRPPTPRGMGLADTCKFYAPKFTPSTSMTPEPLIEDEETICIRLLAHLKKNPSERENYESQLQLIKKTNAAIRRLLKSRATQNDYSCQMLLSTIATHLVAMCERVCQYRPMQTDFLHDHFMMDTVPGYLDTSMVEQQTAEIHDSAKVVVNEAAVLSSAIGDLLKRRPLMNGYQGVGRHESLHVDLDVRVKKALLILN